MVDIQWANIQGERHVLVATSASTELEVLCGMTGTPDAPGLPCEGCRTELWSVVEATLPVLTTHATPMNHVGAA